MARPGYVRLDSHPASTTPQTSPKRARTSWLALLGIALSLGLIIGLPSSHHAAAAMHLLPAIGQTRSLPRNSQLLQLKVAQRLKERLPLRVGVVGGSISAMEDPYADHVARWLNRNWPAGDNSSHQVFNKAIPASESGSASLCLRSLFAGDLDGEPSSAAPIDLLLVEFAFNDYALPVGDESVTEFVSSRTANYERIFRDALDWEVPSLVVEVSKFSEGDLHSAPTNRFFESAAFDHAQVAQHYGVPIVDYARLLYTWPNVETLPELFKDQTHPTQRGHDLIAGLVAQEILYHVALGTTGSILPPSPTRGSGPSWSSFTVASSRRFVDTADMHVISPSQLAPLSPLPSPRWYKGHYSRWSCYSSQMPQTRRQLLNATVETDGWAIRFSADEPNIDEPSVRFKPGYRTNTFDARLSYKLGVETGGRSVLLHRRSWQGEVDVWAWVDQNAIAQLPLTLSNSTQEGSMEQLKDDTPRCPPTPRRLTRRWDARTTQMVLDQVCGGTAEWSHRAESGKDSYLHLVTVEAAELPADLSASRRLYEVFGFAIEQL
ncbi:hypothetical protein ACM66B_003293 [Microbotryomycetes sp. NB124-2]